MANVTSSLIISRAPLARKLSDNGTQEGVLNANGDYSQNPTRFFVGPPVQQNWTVTAFSITIEVSGSREINDYGNITGGLTNGIKTFVRNNSFDIPVYPEIKTNADLISFGDGGDIATFGAGGYTIVLRESVTAAEGFFLDGAKSDLFIFELSDNFSSLLKHTFLIKGFTQGDI